MSMNPLRLLSRNHDAEFVAAVADEIERDPPRFPPLPMIDKAQVGVAKGLDQMKTRRDRLEAEIAERQEDLRQTCVVIEALEASERILEAGQDSEKLSPAEPEVERLVPRGVRGASAEMGAAEEVRDVSGKVVKSRRNQVEAAE